MKSLNYSNFFLILILISLSISPSFALGVDNRNLLLIGVMFFSPLIILIKFHLVKSDLLILVFIASIIFIPIIHQPDRMRWTTVMYSAMFCLTFMAYHRLLNSGSLLIENYLILLKILIFAYFIVLLIQQFCVITGLPIFNLSNYNPDEPWKLNSLAAEPSHSARIVALLMFCFISIKELISGGTYIFKDNLKQDKWVWLAFIWCMTTMGSALAFLLIPVIFLKFLKVRNLIPLLLIIAVVVMFSNKLGSQSVIRAYKTTLATISLDEKKIIEADHSASMRIVPFLINIKIIDLASFDGWFGHGIDYVSSYLYKNIPGISKEASGGGMSQIAVEYGLFSTLLFIFFSFKYSIIDSDYICIILWALLVFLNGINNQITWLAIILLFTNKYFNTVYKL